MKKPTKRKVIHTSNVVFAGKITTIATCNDGTVWSLRNDKGAGWVQVQDLPE